MSSRGINARPTDPPIKADLIGVFVFGEESSTPNSHDASSSQKVENLASDFRNFQYQPACLEKRVVQVTNGRWDETKGNETSYFRVISVTHGDLDGEGGKEAVVWAACGGVANFEIGDILVFSLGSGSSHLLAELSPPDWGSGQQDNGGDFQVSDVRIANRQLAISFYAGGSHAQPAWIVTARFQWNGSRLLRVGTEGKPFTGWPRQ